MALAFLAFSQHYEVFHREGMLSWVIYSPERHNFFSSNIVNIMSHVLAAEASLSIYIYIYIYTCIACSNGQWVV